MQELRYTVGGDSCYVSREAILKAFRKTRPAKGRKYFVWWRGKPYPPKDVLRCMSKGPAGVSAAVRPQIRSSAILGSMLGKAAFQSGFLAPISRFLQSGG